MTSLKVPECVPSPEEDAENLNKAFKGWGTNEATIVGILAHRNGGQRKLIQEAYAATYGNLVVDLEKELSGNFLHAVLLWMLDPADRDAQLAYEAIKELSTPASKLVIIEISCTRSSFDLFKVRQAYMTHYKKSLEEDVAYQTTGDFGKLLVPLVSAFRYEGTEVSKSLAESEAKILHDKIIDKAYADDGIIRILSTRSKAQINATLKEYETEFGNIIKDLKGEAKDEYITLVTAIIQCLTCPEAYFEKTLGRAMKKLGTDETALTRVIVTQAEVHMERIKEEYVRRNGITLDSTISGDTSGDYKKFLLALLGHGDGDA